MRGYNVLFSLILKELKSSSIKEEEEEKKRKEKKIKERK